MDALRHQSYAPDGSGRRPAGPHAEPPFGAPPYGVPPSGASGPWPYPYGPPPCVPPQRTARFGSPYPGTTPYPVLYPAPYAARDPGAPPRWGRDLPSAVLAGIAALVLAGVVTLVVLISHAAPGAASGTAGGRQVVTSPVATDTQAQGGAVLAANRSRPSILIAP